MLKVALKHYIIDNAISLFFERVSTNFTRTYNHFPELYRKRIGCDVMVMLTDSCVYDRNLPVDYVFGSIILLRKDSIGIQLSDTSANKFGWNGIIYLYESDIYKLDV